LRTRQLYAHAVVFNNRNHPSGASDSLWRCTGWDAANRPGFSRFRWNHSGTDSRSFSWSREQNPGVFESPAPERSDSFTQVIADAWNKEPDVQG
jgi:hypothetical protein